MMKKIFLILICGIMLFGICGCDEKNKSNESENNNQSSTGTNTNQNNNNLEENQNNSTENSQDNTNNENTNQDNKQNVTNNNNNNNQSNSNQENQKTNSEEITKDNILNKLLGCWIRPNDNLCYAGDEYSCVNSLCFMGNNVVYFNDYKHSDLSIISTRAMSFTNSTFDFEYLNEKELTFNGEYYTKTSDKKVLEAYETASTKSNPLLTLQANEIKLLYNKDRQYLQWEYVRINNIIFKSNDFIEDNPMYENTLKISESPNFFAKFSDNNIKNSIKDNSTINIVCKMNKEIYSLTECDVIK